MKNITLLEILTITVSVSSLISSIAYTYVYVVGQQTQFFHEIHTEYAGTPMMEAFDLLESFKDATGPAYGPEYLRLKSLSRQAYQSLKSNNDTSTLSRFAELFSSGGSSHDSDIAFGRKLDSSRRMILHYWAKIHMFHQLGYLNERLLSVFPGRTRAELSLGLVEPLVEATAQLLNRSSVVHDHQQVLDNIRQIYRIPKKTQTEPADAEPDL
eukprot:TRINITY_DN785_c0_g1_i19.p1 TRINITY_DN785_c0_g1~~TRINITY_DN785_c0_g1_i19.p1  ORF type:complete len:212 (+),score=47.37 TRINITY_DN785_c0_g1_i19:116-751(+)